MGVHGESLGICWLLLVHPTFFFFCGEFAIILKNCNVVDPLDLGHLEESVELFVFPFFVCCGEFKILLLNYHVIDPLDLGNPVESAELLVNPKHFVCILSGIANATKNL